MIDAPSFARCTSLRYLVCGGESLDGALVAAVRERLPTVRIGNFYGPTEATVDATSHEVIDTPAPGAVIPIGHPVSHAYCRLLDADLQPVPVGTTGELFIGGAGLARGYLGLPDDTARRFLADPSRPGARLYRTGDLARQRDDGSFEYVGRIDTQVKLRGYRIELGEIEQVLLALPVLRQAAVVVRDDTPGNPQLVAYVVPVPGHVVDASSVRLALGEQVPAFMVPASIITLEALPLTANGKLDRQALPAPTDLPDGSGGRSWLISDATDRTMQRLWARTLGTNALGLDDDFFALGGHSLMAIRLLGAIEEEFGILLRASVLFQAPTARALAAVVRASALPGPTEESTLIPVHRAGSARPLFVAPGGGGEMLVFDALSRALGADQPLYVLDIYAFAEPPPGADPLTLQTVATRMLADLRAVQPNGPYRLAGYSLGGNIVYEIAQQLRAAGEAVELLALLDADGPDYPILQPFLVRTSKHLQHATSLGVRGMVRYLSARAGNLTRKLRRAEVQAPDLFTKEAESEALPAHVVEATERALTPVLRAWERYRPVPYNGDVLLVRATQRQTMIGVMDDDPMLGWTPMLHGAVTQVEIDCDHFSLLRPARAPALAAILAAQLAAAPRRAIRAPAGAAAS
jgi:thioesterase domain-containing protein/acyl carrier protein